VTAYKRVLLKLSGEVFGGGKVGLDLDVINSIAREVADCVRSGVQVAIVVGGGNFFRGAELQQRGMERARADYMGMLATVMNALALQSGLERLGVPARTLSAIPMPTVCESFVRSKALHHLESGRVVIFAAGTGNPFFTTDTTAALRAVEMNCRALAKATQVDGVYSDDPKTNPKAERYDRLTYAEVLARDLKVMDASAIALARENAIPIIVFSLRSAGALLRVLRGDGPHTMIAADAPRAKEVSS